MKHPEIILRVPGQPERVLELLDMGRPAYNCSLDTVIYHVRCDGYTIHEQAWDKRDGFERLAGVVLTSLGMMMDDAGWQPTVLERLRT